MGKFCPLSVFHSTQKAGYNMSSWLDHRELQPLYKMLVCILVAHSIPAQNDRGIWPFDYKLIEF